MKYITGHLLILLFLGIQSIAKNNVSPIRIVCKARNNLGIIMYHNELYSAIYANFTFTNTSSRTISINMRGVLWYQNFIESRSFKFLSAGGRGSQYRVGRKVITGNSFYEKPYIVLIPTDLINSKAKVIEFQFVLMFDSDFNVDLDYKNFDSMLHEKKIKLKDIACFNLRF